MLDILAEWVVYQMKRQTYTVEAEHWENERWKTPFTLSSFNRLESIILFDQTLVLFVSSSNTVELFLPRSTEVQNLKKTLRMTE